MGDVSERPWIVKVTGGPLHGECWMFATKDKAFAFGSPRDEYGLYEVRQATDAEMAAYGWRTG